MNSRAARGLFKLGTVLIVGLLLSMASAETSVSPQTAQLETGLQVAIQSDASDGGIDDVIVLPGVSLFVAQGHSVTPFVRVGAFRAVWSGFISSELRSEYRFRAELNGSFQLEINGVKLLDLSATNGETALSPAIRLNKGTNALTALFTAAPGGDSYIRLFWMPKGSWSQPVPGPVFSHLPSSPSLSNAAKRRLGRELFLEHRCARCHLSEGRSRPAELSMDAPAFDGIGSRRPREWLESWIRDPKAERPSARMPRFFHERGDARASAVAAYLATLGSPPGPPPGSGGDARERTDSQAGADDALREAGRRCFDRLHCTACHDPLDTPESDPQRISLKRAGASFMPGQLAEFLRKPERHFAWTRMPNFKLSEQEVNELAAYLSGTSATNNMSAPADDLVAQGKELVQTTGCLSCHELPLENRFTAKALADLRPERWTEGCLAAELPPRSRTPWFAFSPAEREALQSFASHTQSALCEAPMEFAQRRTRDLRCAECHGKVAGFPGLELLGEKLRAEWSRSFLAGELPYRPRPWLEARMPAFPAYAAGLAEGMAALHGLPSRAEPEPSGDPEAVTIGQRLVSAEGGLSCIACHSVGKVSATQVFENAGINLAYTHARLRKAFYLRWLRNPLAIDPVSKMPMFFDEEQRSVLTDVYDGDGPKQMEAIWQYLRLEDKMPPPPGAAAE